MHKSNQVSLGTQLTQLGIQYCNRIIILSTQIIHKKQKNTKNKTFFILQYSTLKSIAVPKTSLLLLMLTSGHPGLEIKILDYCTLHTAVSQSVQSLSRVQLFATL